MNEIPGDGTPPPVSLALDQVGSIRGGVSVFEVDVCVRVISAMVVPRQD